MAQVTTHRNQVVLASAPLLWVGSVAPPMTVHVLPFGLLSHWWVMPGPASGLATLSAVDMPGQIEAAAARVLPGLGVMQLADGGVKVSTRSLPGQAAKRVTSELLPTGPGRTFRKLLPVAPLIPVHQ